MDTPGQRISLPFPVPYAAQIASEELANEFFTHDRPLASDPRWAESGAASPEEYAYWANRACGMACVKMCVEALGGPVWPLLDWVRAGLQQGGYHTRRGSNGETIEIGWLHSCLADQVLPYARRAKPVACSLDGIVRHISKGRLVIASVSYEIGTALPITRKKGHLVVLTGAEITNGDPSALILHNPSGRSPELRRHAVIPAARFAAAYSGRAIVIEALG